MTRLERTARRLHQPVGAGPRACFLLAAILVVVALMFPLKHGGLALATSIATAVNVGMLWIILRRHIGKILDRDFYRSLGRTVLASVVMWGIILLLGLIYPWDTDGPFDSRFIHLMLCVVGGAGAFFFAAYLLKSPEMTEAVGSIRRRLSPKHLS